MAGRGNPAMKRGAPSVNPFGIYAERQFQNAVRLACSEEHRATGLRKLRIIATKLVNKACDGDLVAIGMVADRLDGKPISEHVSTNRGVLDMSDQELLAIIAEARQEEDDSGDTSLLIENDTAALPDKQGDS